MAKGLMTVELRGLRAFAPHGLYPEEQQAGNEFELHISLSYPVADDSISSIEQTINYVDAYAIASAIFGKREDLLETVAMRIMEELYRAFPFLHAGTINIQKLTPPIPNFMGSLGVTYSKTYN